MAVDVYTLSEQMRNVITFHGSLFPTRFSKIFWTTTMGEFLSLLMFSWEAYRRSKEPLTPTGMDTEAKLPIGVCLCVN